MNWDDLKYLAAVGRLGSFTQAAQALGVTHSSVSRRMKELEGRLGVKLLNRHPRGYKLTVAGAELFAAASRMAEEVDAAERRISGRDTELRGLVRFATVDATACNLMPCLKRFQDRYREIELDVAIGPELRNLSRREVDVVLRATNAPPETLVGRRVAEHAFPIYGAPALIAKFGRDTPLDALPWVSWGDGMTRAWMEKHMPAARVVCRVNTALGMVEAVRAGIGIGHLACYGVDRNPDFVRLGGPHADLALGLWLLTHRDLLDNARIRAFMDFVAAEIEDQRDLIEGRCAT